ncbi:MAG: exodeoxyribonuclease V subunit gamma [Myxococcales bacterium]|nr:exodeoxyribonuclease V subunit gamma [Myxococcales bacterium]
MPLHLYRSNRTEQLVQRLAASLVATRPPDPFDEQPIVVGSRGMERWLRHQIATHRGIATRLAFPFPGPALDGGVRALLGLSDPTRPFWARVQGSDGWSAEALSWRVVLAMRTLLNTPEHAEVMARVARYLQPEGEATATGPIGPREHAFATQVASAIDEVLRMRPDTARTWLATTALDGSERPGLAQGELSVDERWLALMLKRLRTPDSVVQTDDKDAAPVHPMWNRDLLAAKLRAPIAADDQAVTRTPARQLPALHIFGLSTLPAEELKTLALISGPGGLEVHLYLLAPSRAWFGDMPSRDERRKNLRALGRRLDKAEISGQQRYERQREELDKAEQNNRLLADLGRPSRDLQALLELHADHYQEIGTDGVPGGDDLFVCGEEQAQPAGATVLRTLQDAIAQATPDRTGETARLPIEPTDRSLRFLPCHGPLRQVEVLRDALLAAFSRDETLQPRDVLVMTPDIATFAPLIAAVFGDEGQGQPRPKRDGKETTKLPAIPVDISDLGLRASNRVADVLLNVLELATERVTLPALLNLMQLQPLRERFGLGSDDLADLQRMLQGSGVRWGIDALDRAAFSQPPLHQNTVAFGLERVALGALFLDETDLIAAGELPLRVHSSSQAPAGSTPGSGSTDAHPFVPFDATDSDSVDRFGRLYAAVTAVLHHRRAVQRATTAGGWLERVQALLADLTETTDASAWLTSRVLAEVTAMTSAARAGIGDTEIELGTIVSELNGRFELPRTGDRPISGGVSVCAMEPMRSVPFRIVALLGMDPEAFPRQSRRRAWHPMATGRRMGEHDRRDIDRHLLLEALLSAREQFLVLWRGFDGQTGEPLPEAVPIVELMETVDGQFAAPSTIRDAPAPRASAWLTQTGALQPWSEARFAGGSDQEATPLALGFDVPMCTAALQLRERTSSQEVANPGQIIPGDLSTIGHKTGGVETELLDVLALARALSNPAKVLLSRRFGLHWDDDELAPASREALELDSLQRWQLRDQALKLALAGHHEGAAAYLSERWRGQGLLPIGPAAAASVQVEVQSTIDMLQEALALIGGELTPPIAPQQLMGPAVRSEAGDVQIVLSDARLWPDPMHAGAYVLLAPFAGSRNLKRSLTAWLSLLVAVTARPDLRVSGALLVTRPNKKGKSASSAHWIEVPSDPTRELEKAVRLWRRTQVAPVPLFEKTSWGLAEVLEGLQISRGDRAMWSALDPAERLNLRATASQCWQSSAHSKGDEDDRWIAAIWGEPDFEAVLPVDGSPVGERPEQPDDAQLYEGQRDEADDTAEPAWIAWARALLMPVIDAQRPYASRLAPAGESVATGGGA